MKLRYIFAPLLALAMFFAGCSGSEEPGPDTPPDDPTENPGENPVIIDAPDDFTTPSEVYIIRINTGGKEITTRKAYVSGTMSITSSGSTKTYHSNLPMEIKGRGNSTWGMPKKPYKIKLAAKQRLLGMSKNKHWTLLANYSDKTLLRNTLAFELSRVAGMHWAVRSRPAELYLNGGYKGLYMLTEHIRVDPERIDMDVVNPSASSGDAVTGGYLLAIDSRNLDEGVPGFKTSRGLPVSFEDPETLTAQQRAYIEGFMKQTELDIYNLTFEQYSGIIDIDSFIQYFFVHEIAKNVDGDMRLSTFMWKPRNGRLGFPCVWDFDIAFGNCDYNGSGNGPTGWHIRNCIWFRQLFRNRSFADRVTVAWRELYPKLGGVEANIREWARVMDDAQKRNFQTWRILGVDVWPNYKVFATYGEELEYMLGFFNARIEWMNTEIEAGRHFKTD